MKWIITISAILLFALAGCGKDKQSTNELITVDVTKNYPDFSANIKWVKKPVKQ